MKKIAPIHRKLVEEKAPQFANAVSIAVIVSNAARAGVVGIEPVPVLTSLDEFPDQDMALVYACLWYAYCEGIPVTMQPPQAK